MNNFNGILICTDLDGTLLMNDKSISPQNLDAIEYFKSKGGYFTFVTGRMPFTAVDMCATVKPNAPFGCINGGGLYDFQKQQYIHREPLDSDYMKLVECIDKKVPAVGFQVNMFDTIYFSKENSVMEKFRELTGAPDIRCHYKDITGSVAKVVFGVETDEELKQTAELLSSHPLSHKFSFIRSEKYLYEILPKKSGKGCAVQNLVTHLNINPKHTIAVGDYNNDISMFEASALGVAVSNACSEALDAADYVTVSNEEHAIAQIIRDLEDGKICL